MSSSVDQVLHDAVAAGAVPNVVAIAADRDGVVYEGAAGPHAVGADDRPVGPDTHFRIMSMTKMVVTAAALQLVERGDLDLGAPVDVYRPEFADVQVLEGFDGDSPKLRPAGSRATVHQLVTHTTGLGYWFWNADIVAWEKASGTPNVLSGSNVIFTAPLVADPGTSYEYGINTDWLGKVVEAVSGQGLDAYVAEHVTGPLGMRETGFRRDERQRANTTPVHLRGDTGAWVPTTIEMPDEPEYWAGGHGLYSTPRDYIRFERALLRGGELDGERILAETTVDEAFTNQIGDLDFPAAIATADPASTDSFEIGPGFKWGHGLLLNTDDVPGRRRAGSGAWAGLCNTQFWIDRTAGVCGSIYSNFLPFVPPEALQLYADFETALYASAG